MGIQSNMIIFFDGASINIPIGYKRWTAANGRFLQGPAAGVEPAVTGGATLHSHTNGSHSHTQSHTHGLTMSGAVTSTNTLLNSGSARTAADHTHTIKGYTASDTTPTGSATIICGSTVTRPKRIEVIALKPSSGEVGFPVGGIALSEKDLSQGSWGITPNTDFEDCFMFAVSGDGGTATGSDSHNHSLTSHTHTFASHTHANSNFGGAILLIALHNIDLITSAMSDYVHHTAVSIQNYGLVSLAIDQTPYDSASSLPPYRTLLTMEYNGASATDDIPEGLIVGWIGNRADIPTGWEEVTELREKQVRVTRVRSKVGNEGGAATHTHTKATHTHSDSSAHLHTFTEGTANTAARSVDGAGTARPSNTHTHGSGGTMDTRLIKTDANSDYTVSTESHLYSNITMIYIRKSYVVRTDIDGATQINGNTQIGG